MLTRSVFSVFCSLISVMFIEECKKIITVIFGMVLRVFRQSSEKQDIFHSKTGALEKQNES